MKTLMYLRQFVLFGSVFLLLGGVFFARYYEVKEADKSHLIIPVESFIESNKDLTEFLGTLEQKVPDLKIHPDEFQKKSLFE